MGGPGGGRVPPATDQAGGPRGAGPGGQGLRGAGSWGLAYQSHPGSHSHKQQDTARWSHNTATLQCALPHTTTDSTTQREASACRHLGSISAVGQGFLKDGERRSSQGHACTPWLAAERGEGHAGGRGGLRQRAAGGRPVDALRPPAGQAPARALPPRTPRTRSATPGANSLPTTMALKFHEMRLKTSDMRWNTPPLSPPPLCAARLVVMCVWCSVVACLV